MVGKKDKVDSSPSRPRNSPAGRTTGVGARRGGGGGAGWLVDPGTNQLLPEAKHSRVSACHSVRDGGPFHERQGYVCCRGHQERNAREEEYGLCMRSGKDLLRARNERGQHTIIAEEGKKFYITRSECP